MMQFYRYHAFVSYQSGDGDAAAAVVHRLQARGLRVWFDRDSGEHDRDSRSPDDARGRPIAGGEAEVHSALESAILKSVLMVVLTSRSTLPSVWVRAEVAIARAWGKPLFFWHIPDRLGPSFTLRRSGSLWDGKLETLEEAAQGYKTEHAAASFTTTLIQEFSTQEDLNIVGHSVLERSSGEDIAEQLGALIELCELILHYRETITEETMQKRWPEYERLCEEADTLSQAIAERFGRRVSVGREPYPGFSRFSRPFVKKRVRHLQRLLDDEAFRGQEFGKLDNRS